MVRILFISACVEEVNGNLERERKIDGEKSQHTLFKIPEYWLRVS